MTQDRVQWWVLRTDARIFLKGSRTAEGLTALQAVGDLSSLVLSSCRLLLLSLLSLPNNPLAS